VGRGIHEVTVLVGDRGEVLEGGPALLGLGENAGRGPLVGRWEGAICRLLLGQDGSRRGEDEEGLHGVMARISPYTNCGKGRGQLNLEIESWY